LKAGLADNVRGRCRRRRRDAEGEGGFQSGRVEADGTDATRNSDVFGNDADSLP
jgi:hypothetical protein